MVRLLLFLTFLLPTLVSAQKEYSFVKDRVVLHAQDLFGVTFVPSEGKLSNAHFIDPVKKGLVQFKITSSVIEITERVTFTTKGIGKENDAPIIKMSVSRIDKTGYGYSLILVDIQNHNITGYLKVYVNNQGFVERLLYKAEESQTERTYSLSSPPDYIEVRDSKFFTHTLDHKLESISDLYGKTIFPFGGLKPMGDYKEYSRIYPDDRVTIKIEERMVLKGKKEKEAQFFVLNDGRMKDSKKEFMIRKVKEVKVTDAITRSERQALALYGKDDSTEEEFTVFLYKDDKQRLRSIGYGEYEYTFRLGKRIID